ncbi:MAG: hypothetical protein WBH45_00240, partial [Acidobacteriaceae bacterium]
AAQAQPAAAPEPFTAKTAFWVMYKAAHNWAPDAEPIRVTAKEVPGFKNDAGKAAMWEAVFASPSLHQYETFTDSIADAPPDIYKGVVAGLAQPWGGATRDAMPIDVTSFNVDSDAAYTAAAAAAADWLKNNPGKPLSAFEVGDTSKFQVPVWYVMWGTKTAGYATIVDASTGKVLHK